MSLVIQMTSNTINSRNALYALTTRRSAKPRELVEPGPNPEQLRQMITIAARTPDHGKLTPWRFVIVRAEQRELLAATFVDAYIHQKPDAGRLELEATRQFAVQAPALVVALYAPKLDSHIPAWEQQLSVGAACMNLLHAAHAMGFAASWLTGWAAYSDDIRNIFAAAPQRIAGFLFIGTRIEAAEDRPRPSFESIASDWAGHSRHALALITRKPK